MNIKIEKGIPIPKTNASKQSGPKRIFPGIELMKINDSFFVPTKVKSQKYTSSIIANHAKRLGWKFAIRKVKGGCRVWRIRKTD